MKEVLCFIYEGFADFESVLACSGVNGDENHEVKYIAYEREPVYTSSGLRINPDKLVSEIDGIDNIDGIIIPGGGNRIFKPELKELINKLHKAQKLVAAICAGPEFLAKSGILDGKKYTTTRMPEAYEEINEEDPFPRDTYVETRVIQDGNIITAKGYAFTDFALKIWEYFDLYDDEEEKEQLRKDYTPD